MTTSSLTFDLLIVQVLDVWNFVGDISTGGYGSMTHSAQMFDGPKFLRQLDDAAMWTFIAYDKYKRH